MGKHVKAIICELKIILTKISACIMSINKDVKSIDCTSSPNPERITASVAHKLEILRECAASVQRISQHLKECYSSKSESSVALKRSD